MAWSASLSDFGANPNFPGGGDNRALGAPSKIADLAPGKPTNLLVGVVIAKEDCKSFVSKKDPSKENFLQSFTIRDSPRDFINVTCWGGQDFIYELKDGFHIGDIVEIENPMVQSKSTTGNDERFRPSTPSQYQLSLSEKHSRVVLAPVPDPQLTRLYHMPVKPNNDYYTIADILANGPASLNGELINMLVIVKSVSPVKEITTKQGKKKRRCEVKLLDDTVEQAFSLTLWDDELIHLAQSWIPKEHVLFIADVRVAENNYQKTMAATACSKTIITTNPDTREAHALAQYAQNAELGSDDGPTMVPGEQAVDLSSIHTVCSTRDVKTRLEGAQKSESRPEFVIVYAVITALDLDSSDQSGVKVKCSKCHYRMDTALGMCSNKECVQGIETDVIPEVMETETLFDLRISVTDYTGTLEGCILSGTVAENMLQCKVGDFLTLTEDDRTNIKWRYLLERCKLYLKLSRSSKGGRSFVKVVACELADLKELAVNR